MSEHELEKLLGGFAADTLTPEERQKLFTAGLQDQQLFNALADEQALRELLADPAVRRRLLNALSQTGASGAGNSLSWLDWLRRPATLAYAGGLAVAVLAVVLGTKVYQESLKEAAQSVATEESKPAEPSPMPQSPQPAQAPLSDAEPKANAPAAGKSAKKERTDTVAKLEQAAQQRDQRSSRTAADDKRQRAERDEGSQAVEAPVAGLGKSAVDATPSADQKQTAPTPPSGAGAPAVSARALFYAEPDARSGMMAQEQERAMKPSAESAPKARPETKMDRFALARKAPALSEQVKPLGLRYGFLVRGADGKDREANATTAAHNPESAFLTVETNQDAYLQIWQQGGAVTPQLLFPQKETGQISLRIAAGQRQRIQLPVESETLTLRLSRVPFGPLSRQEAFMLGRPSPGQIQETVTSSPVTGQDQATYVVNQDLSPTAQIDVQIPLLH